MISDNFLFRVEDRRYSAIKLMKLDRMDTFNTYQHRVPKLTSLLEFKYTSVLQCEQISIYLNY